MHAKSLGGLFKSSELTNQVTNHLSLGKKCLHAGRIVSNFLIPSNGILTCHSYRIDNAQWQTSLFEVNII